MFWSPPPHLTTRQRSLTCLERGEPVLWPEVPIMKKCLLHHSSFFRIPHWVSSAHAFLKSRPAAHVPPPKLLHFKEQMVTGLAVGTASSLGHIQNVRYIGGEIGNYLKA